MAAAELVSIADADAGEAWRPSRRALPPVMGFRKGLSPPYVALSSARRVNERARIGVHVGAGFKPAPGAADEHHPLAAWLLRARYSQ
jgi:hypothetical protein